MKDPTAAPTGRRRPAATRGRAFRTLDGRTLRLRAVRSGDIDAFKRGFARLTPEQVRQRTFHRMNELSDEAAHRLVGISLAPGDKNTGKDDFFPHDLGKHRRTIHLVVDEALPRRLKARLRLVQMSQQHERFDLIKGIVDVFGAEGKQRFLQFAQRCPAAQP